MVHLPTGFGTGILSYSSVEVGNGWYRCFVTTKGLTINAVRIYVMATSGTTTTAGSFYLQDAQVNQGLVAMPYLPTTTTTSVGGILANQPRIDFTGGGCGSLLLEPSRTNLVPYSEYLASIPWNNNTLTFSWDTSLLNLEGYYGAQKVIGIGTSVYNNMASGVNIGDKLCYSIWAKSSSNANFKFGGLYGGENATFDVSTGSLVAQGAELDSYEVIEYSNGWRRYIIVINYSGAGGNNAYGHIEWNDASQPIYLYGLQLEQNATYATSLIPTYGTSVTRAQDVCGDAGNSSTFNDSEGVLFLDVENVNATSAISISDDSSSNFIQIYLDNTSLNPIRYRASSGGTSQFDTSFAYSLDVSQPFKIALRYSTNNFSIWINGVKANEVLSGSTPVGLSTIEFYNIFGAGTKFDGKLKQILTFNTALSDADLATLTTI